VKESDRERYRGETVSLGKKLATAFKAEPVIDEQAVWEVYAGAEKLIAVLRFRLDYETPGTFTELPDASNQVALLEDARAHLTAAADHLSAKRMIEAVETLRKARNDLRSYLTEKRKAVTKADRSTHARPAIR
jgi:hypothetical protein